MVSKIEFNEIFSDDITYSTIKCIGFPIENGEKQIQISINNHPFSMRLMKYLTVDEAKQFIKIIEHEIELANKGY